MISHLNPIAAVPASVLLRQGSGPTRQETPTRLGIWSGYVGLWPQLAVLALLLNDHVLKASGALPGALTGKLSDLAGLFFFPLLLAALWHAIGARLSARTLLWACGLTALMFSAIQLSGAAVRAYSLVLRGLPLLYTSSAPSVTMDPSDLLALPMVALAYLYGRRHLHRDLES